MTNEITIPLSEELRKKLEEIVKQTNFKSVEEYILFFLEQILSQKGDEKQGYTEEDEAGISGGHKWKDDDKKKQGYTKEEEQDLKQTLEDMGYL